MLKKFVTSVIALFLLAGCSSGSSAEAAAAADPASDAAKIVEDLNLSDHMDQVQDRIVSGLFFFDEGVVTQSAVYIANDKSADVVGVFETTDADSCRKAIQTYLDSAKTQMQNYFPDEVFKLDNAVVEDNGSTVILIACSDLEGAKKEADSILGK